MKRRRNMYDSIKMNWTRPKVKWPLRCTKLNETRNGLTTFIVGVPYAEFGSKRGQVVWPCYLRKDRRSDRTI
jgi:hypothetical protein